MATDFLGRDRGSSLFRTNFQGRQGSFDRREADTDRPQGAVQPRLVGSALTTDQIPSSFLENKAAALVLEGGLAEVALQADRFQPG